MKILITGGNGNLGLWIRECFLQHGASVTCFSRRDRFNIDDPAYTFVEGDITQPESFSRLASSEFDICVHLASYNEHFAPDYRESALRINTLGTANVCDFLNSKGVKRIIYMSTVHVYDLSREGVIDEHEAPCPVNDYGLTHLFAEQYVLSLTQNTELESVIFRLSNSYGAPKYAESDKWYLILNDFAKQAWEDKKIVLKSNGNLYRDFVWMKDVAEIVWKSCEGDINPGVYNLSSGSLISLRNIAHIVADLYLDLFQENVPVVINQDDDNVYPQRRVSSDKLLSEIDFEFSDQLKQEVEGIWALLGGKH